MSTNKEVHKMRAQILNLRSAVIALSSAVCNFPQCGRPLSCNHECPEARALLGQIYKDFQELLISARMVLEAVFCPAPKRWDSMWRFAEVQTSPERILALLGRMVISDQDEYVRYCGQMDGDMMDALGTGFSEQEWEVLSAEDAWQNEHRLSQILNLANHLETQMEKKFDLLLLTVSNCEVGKQASSKEAARA
jgi:hypothetical protein